jgi:hypothetical protein
VKKLLVLSSMMMIVSGVSKAADAGLFVEPSLTYERGRGDVNFPAPINSQDTQLDGFGIGARVGFHVMESLFVGADGRYSMPKFKSEGLNQDVEAKAWNVGPVVGVQMPTIVGLRVWAGYVLAGEVDPERSNNVDQKFKSASGYRVGAGIKLGIASVNIEYQSVKYDETLIEDVGVFTPNTTRGDIELDNSSTLLSVSFPIAI